MACNCKNKIRMEERYGTKVDDGAVSRTLNFLLKVFVFLIVILMGVVITPIVFIVAIYKIFFGKDKGIIIPKSILEAIKRL